jgi:hypothetical protein
MSVVEHYHFYKTVVRVLMQVLVCMHYTKTMLAVLLLPLLLALSSHPSDAYGGPLMSKSPTTVAPTSEPTAYVATTEAPTAAPTTPEEGRSV